jgi:hypothetical protein
MRSTLLMLLLLLKSGIWPDITLRRVVTAIFNGADTRKIGIFRLLLPLQKSIILSEFWGSYSHFRVGMWNF